MDYMGLTVRCSRKAVKFDYSQTHWFLFNGALLGDNEKTSRAHSTDMVNFNRNMYTYMIVKGPLVFIDGVLLLGSHIVKHHIILVKWCHFVGSFDLDEECFWRHGIYNSLGSNCNANSETDVEQDWLRQWLDDWRHQAITRTNIDLSSATSHGIPAYYHNMDIPNSKTRFKSAFFKSNPNLPGANTEMPLQFYLVGDKGAFILLSPYQGCSCRSDWNQGISSRSVDLVFPE